MRRHLNHEFEEHTGYKIGYKPAGGFSVAKDVMNYQFLMKDELGNEWLQPFLFRIEASSLLVDIERQLEHYVTIQLTGFAAWKLKKILRKGKTGKGKTS